MKLTSPASINQLSQEKFDELTPDQIREMAGETKAVEDEDLEEGGNEDSEDTDETSDENDDDQGSDDTSDEDTDTDDSDEGESEDDETPEDEDVDEDSDSDKGTDVSKTEPPKKAKAPAKDKAQSAEEPSQLSYEELAAFHKQVTGEIKASGEVFKFTDPTQIIQLAQKGVDYTKKMQAVSHLRGVNEVLKENDLLDPAKLAFAVDVMNHKPEAIAKLLKESGHEAYDLDEEKADEYVNIPADFEAKAKAYTVREIVEQNQANPKFNAMFTEARSWDDESQVALVKNPDLLNILADHADRGVYDQVMQRVKQERILSGTNEPVLSHYYRVGSEMFPEDGNGGSAQAPKPTPGKQAPTKTVVVKRSRDVSHARKIAAPTNGAKKGGKGSSVKSVSDVFSLSKEDFDNLTPEQLRNLK